MDPTLLLEATREIRSQFINLMDAMSAVKSLSVLDTRHPDIRSLLDEALHILIRYQDLERCSIFLLRDDRLVCAAGANFAEGYTRDTRDSPQQDSYEPLTFRLDEGVMGLAAQTGEPQYCGDCSRDPRFKILTDASDRSAGCLLCMPISNGNQIFGVINVYHSVKYHLQDWHRNLLAVFASVLAHMLASHFSLVHLEETINQRTQQLQEALNEAEKLKRRYEELSTVDELTELHNRRFFTSEAEAALSRSVRYGDPFCVLILDLDRFKNINDSYGHTMGDQVLKSVADVLKSYVREGDILARYGGEEFVLALPSTPIEGARILAERIRTTINELSWSTLEGQFHASISIGLTCMTDAQPSLSGQHLLDDLVRQADRALYFVKFHGRNQVRTYQEVLDHEASTED